MAPRDSNEIIRPQVDDGHIADGLKDIYSKLLSRLNQKGHGAYASRHEILGILEEEMKEVKDEIQNDGAAGNAAFGRECLDIAVAGLFGYICIRYGYIKPREKNNGKRVEEGSDNRDSLDAAGRVHTS